MFINRMLLNILYFLKILSLVVAMHPEVNLSFDQRVKLHGYPLEVHQVVTEDKYVIELLRIPHGIVKSTDESKNKSAILMMNSIAGSPHNFITMGPKRAPAYYFADRGFDVWLICSRGVHCVRDKKHVKYNWDKDHQYWNYSFHEIGLYDLSASIDYVINNTNQKKLYYIGHGTGVVNLYALMSERPQYNSKIKVTANYAGTPIISEIDYPLLAAMCEMSNIFRGLAKMFDLHEMFPPTVTKVLNPLIKHLCADPKFKLSCKAALWCFGSHVSTLMEDNVVEIVTSGAPPRVSFKEMIHMMDNVKRGHFRHYDYGTKANNAIYGQALPKEYNISSCTVPNAFFRGATDSLAVKEDMWKTQEYIQNTILDYEIGPSFVHLDFLFANNATFMLYKPTVKLFKDFDSGKIPPKILRKRTV